jgi:hypothetical protein
MGREKAEIQAPGLADRVSVSLFDDLTVLYRARGWLVGSAL